MNKWQELKAFFMQIKSLIDSKDYLVLWDGELIVNPDFLLDDNMQKVALQEEITGRVRATFVLYLNCEQEDDFLVEDVKADIRARLTLSHKVKVEY